jgi:16S rRNA (adenine1518-N6/adenine1519-N6)-dimethyltransferase
MKFLRKAVRYHWEFPIQYFDTNCFRTLEYRDQIPEFAGMFQKKWRNAFVKRRTKAYGILSVLVQAFMMQNICLR